MRLDLHITYQCKAQRNQKDSERPTSIHLYPTGVVAGSAVEDGLSSGLSSVEARSVLVSELEDEAVGAAGAVVLGAELVGDGCEAVLA